MKNFCTLLLICLAVTTYGQTFDFIQKNGSAHFHLSGALTSGQNSPGHSLFNLQRTDDTKSSLIQWNLGTALDPSGLTSITADQDYWQFGVNGTDQLKISKYKYRYTTADGIDKDTTHALLVLDDYEGTNATTKPRVVFPGGIIEVGIGIQLSNMGDGNLGISEGNLLPAQQCGTNNLGSSFYVREWNNVVAQALVESDCRIPPGPGTAAFKSNTLGLSDILAIKTMKYSAQKSNEPGKLFIDPYELIKIVPEAVHTHELITDSEGNKVYAEVPNYGMKYTQLIPVLINAIQEQQEMIDNLITETKALRAKIEN